VVKVEKKNQGGVLKKYKSFYGMAQAIYMQDNSILIVRVKPFNMRVAFEPGHLFACIHTGVFLYLFDRFF
jgi:hypothetical protein